MDTVVSLERAKANKKPPMYLLTAGAAVATAITIVLGVLLLHSAHGKQMPAAFTAAKSTVSYPLYYPTPLPKGVSYSKGSLRPSQTVTIYSLLYQGKKIYVSIEPKPEGVVFDDFYNRILANKADVFSTQGKGTIGTANSQLVGSLVTKDSWVLMNASTSIDDQVMQQLVSSMKPIR